MTAPPSDSYRIDTPEHVSIEFQVAGIGSRFLAALADGLIILLLAALVNLVLLISIGILRAEALESVSVWLFAVVGLANFALLWGYYVFFEILWSGQSPGKRWQGLRVIRRNGTPAGPLEIVIRNFVRLIDFIPANYGLGVITMFIDPQSRRLGDMAAGTLVIREQRSSSFAGMVSASSSGLAVPASSPVHRWPIRRLSQEDIDGVESYLRRREELHNHHALGGQLLGSILAKLELPLEEARGVDAETCLEHLVAVWKESS